jgi:NADPH:quinone reductase-like Zn-dependent oxidoreductase
MPRVVRFHHHGGPDVLTIENVDVPPPKADEVQIRVKALGLNRAEALMRAGNYIEKPQLPSGLGLEASGTIERIGQEVSGLMPGDRVSVIPPISMARYPAHGEFATFPQEHVVKHPQALGWEAAAALWMPFLTAYGALIDIADLAPGDFVGITAASSSVGLAAIQVARMVGAVPIAITRTSAKMQALLDIGAAHVIVTADEDLEGRLRDISGADGLRVVLDAVGGGIVGPLAATMSKGGILVEYGGLSSEPTPFPLPIALGKRLTMRGYLVHEVIEDPRKLAAAKTFILEGLASNALRPVVSRTFKFDDIRDAYRYLESNEQFGKVVVTM